MLRGRLSFLQVSCELGMEDHPKYTISLDYIVKSCFKTSEQQQKKKKPPPHQKKKKNKPGMSLFAPWICVVAFIPSSLAYEEDSSGQLQVGTLSVQYGMFGVRVESSSFLLYQLSYICFGIPVCKMGILDFQAGIS